MDPPTAVDATVVVATRNRAALLSAVLRSLAAQICDASFEVVVVDNGSTDATTEVVGDLARVDSRFRIITEPERGLSRAKNTGIRAARGRLVLFTDDDVVLSEGWIAAHLVFFARRRDKLMVAGGPVIAIPQDLSGWPRWVRPDGGVDLPSLTYGDTERPLRKSEWLWGANMAASKDVLESFGGFRSGLGRGAEAATFEDVDLVDRIREAGGEAWYCPEARVFHRVPLSAARPRQILLSAFNRGCNDRVAVARGNYFRPALPLSPSTLAAALTLPWLLPGLAIAAAMFRMTHVPTIFDLTRRLSWGAGWSMWTIVGESPRARARAVRSVVLFVRRVALRVTPA
jgi:glucosyl-dolichyl phosphate glucuronosyltransferase